MIGKALTVASVLAATKAQDYQYVATFGPGNNDITGTVTVDEGKVMVDLDLSAMPDLPTNFSFCTTGGLSYHIHQLWTYDTSDDAVASACGGDYTSGHWDPWQACGGASGNVYCGDDMNNSKCIPKGGDDYAPDYPAMPFSAEVGDWSSKYGKLELDDQMMISAEVSSYWEVIPKEMMGYSVVFHCNNGDRAFCAPFEVTTVETTSTVPNQDTTTEAVTAVFDLLSDDSAITVSATGEVSITLDATADGLYTDAATDGCAAFEFGVFNAGSSELSSSQMGGDCDNAVGAFYDPTHQCPGFSDSPYCFDGMLCEDDSYMYDCDFMNARYSCAPGDMSGKMGAFENPGTEVLSVTATGAYLSPLTSDLVGKVMAIYCAEEDQADLTVFACAPIVATEGEEGSGASHVSFVVGALVAMVATMW